jgi:hypothetical protein
MVAIVVTATVTDAGGHVSTASASATIASGIPTDAEMATWGQTTSTITSNTTYSGSGTVVNGVHFDGARVSFSGTDITLNDCMITGDTSGSPLVSVTNVNARRITLNRCILRPKTPGNRNAIQGQNFSLNDCLIEKTTDGVSVAKSGYTASAANWATGVELHRVVIRKLARWTGAAPGDVHPTDTVTHNDGFVQAGGSGTVLDRVLIDARPALQYAHVALVSASGTIYTEAQAYALADNAPRTGVAVGSQSGGWPFVPAWTSNGTGKWSTGEMSGPDFSCMMILSSQGPSTMFDVRDCEFRGGENAINGGGNPWSTGVASLGTWLRNRFDRSQANQGSGGNDTNTARFSGNWAGHITFPTLGTDANTYVDGATMTGVQF